MVYYIGDIPITSVQQVDISESKSVEEVDLAEKDQNIVFLGEEAPPEIEIDFTLVENIHPEKLEVESQVSEIENLQNKDVEENSITFGDFNGAIAIESISIPEDSDKLTLREGKIQGVYFSWPKYDNRILEPSHTKRLGGKLTFSLKTDGEAKMVLKLHGKTEINLDMDTALGIARKALGDVSFALKFDSGISKFHSVLGNNVLELNYSSQADIYKSTSGKSTYQFDTSGQIKHLYGPFGAQFGRNFGGNT